MKRLLILTSLPLMMFSCNQSDSDKSGKDALDAANPFFSAYDTPFEVPPFHLIKMEHYKPAIMEGIKHHAAEIDQISNASEEPTFENTIEALENSGKLLSKVSSVFYNLNGANTNDEMQQIAREIAPEISAHSDNIRLNDKLFARVKSVWENRNQLTLDEEQSKLLENKYKEFVRSGANLNEEQKSRLREINSELSLLSLQFGQNVLAETNNFELIIEDEKDLAGLPKSLVEAAADDAKSAGHEGKWLFTLHNPSLLPFLQYADNRELRKQIWEAYRLRGNNNNEYDNKQNIRKMVNLRAEKAKLLGYDNHANYVLEERMAKNAENVYDLLNQLWTPALAVAKKEADDILKRIKADGHDFELTPYDWRYYTEKIRAERFDLDESEIKPYFSLENVRDGIFMVTNKLWGLTYKKVEGAPVYHEEVTLYEVIDRDGSHVGVLYMDFHPRASKRGGAWMTSYRSQSVENGKRKAPVISIVCNFSKPTADAPSLLNFDEVTTFFHEFGHALHGLLSDVKYKSLAGTSVPTDFVELPSQVLENWAEDPEVMKMYAKHYKTGEVIPDELIEKISVSGTFGQGFATTEYLAASLLDLDYHSQAEGISEDINEFERKSMEKIGLPETILPRYRSTYFNHIFAGGYSAGYYSYIWSGVLDTDAFDAFKQKALFDPELAESFRTNILERGGTRDAMEMYVNFRGAEPNIEPLLRKRGLSKLSAGKKEVGK
jgi:peptidyl-dipeptidase Dcp